MKGKTMLLGLLVLLGLGGGTSGYLYHEGYWDTWADRAEAIQQAFTDQFKGQAPQAVVEMVSGCLAEGGTKLADKLDCDVPSRDEDARTAVQTCVEDKGAEQQLNLVMITCLMQAQAAAQGE